MSAVSGWMLATLLLAIAAVLLLALWLYQRYQHRQQVKEFTHQLADQEARLDVLYLRFRQLTDAFPATFLVVDQEGKVREAYVPDPEPIRLAIVPAVGQPLALLLPEPLVEAYQHIRARALAGEVAARSEIDLSDSKAQQVVALYLSRLSGSQDGEDLFLLVVRNISESKRAERLKDEFISTVSHEMRTPLTSIAGALGLIAGGAAGDLPPKVREMVQIASKNSQRLSRLVNDLLDIEKITSGKLQFNFQQQALTPLLEQALEANRSYAEKYDITLGLIKEVPGAEVWVDSERLLQVLANLLSNAIKFSPKGERVDVFVNLLDNKTLRVSVADRGVGIAREFRTRIFQKFFQAGTQETSSKEGTGLGLAISKELIEHMGGNISFECAEGSGCIFYFELPLANALGTPNQELPQGKDRRRILVVEDESEVARLIQLMLSQAGYSVDIAATGAEAMAALRESEYAAMTMDLHLPDFSGLEVIRRVRANPKLAHLPIIIVSAKLEAGKLMFSGDTAATEWLAKPVEGEQLLAAVEKQLGGRHRQRVLYVEDDPDLQTVIQTMVGDGYELVSANTLAQARDILEQQDFDVVLLDIGLPDGVGWELLPEIRARLPNARVVILSGAEMSASNIKKAEAVLLKSKITERQLLDTIGARIQTDSATLRASHSPSAGSGR